MMKLMLKLFPAGDLVVSLFIRMNLGAEELEPEALAAAKDEDHKVEKPA